MLLLSHIYIFFDTLDSDFCIILVLSFYLKEYVSRPFVIRNSFHIYTIQFRQKSHLQTCLTSGNG